jgi:AraC-like DNA-binding protein/RimJ/RimL family protein N-acetyltransferase
MDYRPILQKVIYAIEYSLEEDINLTRLSRQAHLSMYHFSRLFVVYTGLTPIEYVRRRRMLRAASAICSGEEILTTAIRYGYSSHSAFSKAFKKVFGYSPSTYRNVGNSHVPPSINLYTRETSTGGKMSKAFETERLIIRNFRPDDWKSIQVLAKNKESSRFARYDLAWPTSDEGCQKTAEFLSSSDFFWGVCLKENGELIGLIAFNSIDDDRTLDFGHLFRTDYMSEEIMTEALRRMAQYTFDELDIERITTRNAADWEGQIAPLRRLGMKKTGEITEKFPADSSLKRSEFTAYVLEISRGDWEKGG